MKPIGISEKEAGDEIQVRRQGSGRRQAIEDPRPDLKTPTSEGPKVEKGESQQGMGYRRGHAKPARNSSQRKYGFSRSSLRSSVTY